MAFLRIVSLLCVHCRYGGIANSLAVEFDTWTNSNFSDLWYDHISIHSMGTDPNIAAENGQLGIDLAAEIGDGGIHAVKVRATCTPLVLAIAS